MERSNFRINRIYSYEEAFNEVDRLNRAFETFLDNYLTLLDRLRITPYVKNDDEYIQYLKVQYTFLLAEMSLLEEMPRLEKKSHLNFSSEGCRLTG